MPEDNGTTSKVLRKNNCAFVCICVCSCISNLSEIKTLNIHLSRFFLKELVVCEYCRMMEIELIEARRKK